MSLALGKARHKQASLGASRRNGTSHPRSIRKRTLRVHSNGARRLKRSPLSRRGKLRRSSLRTHAPKVSARLSRAPRRNGARSKQFNLVTEHDLCNGHGKDRVMLMARDSFWLHAYWQISLSSVQRAEAALREDWHGAKPILRLFDVSSEDTTSSSERQVRDIELHGTVNNWYIDVVRPSRAYRVDIGYLSRRGRFYALAHSNVVTVPSVGASEAAEEHWASVQEQFERIYAQSGRPNHASGGSDAARASEDRLRRSMDQVPWGNFSLGSLPAGRKRSFWFDLDAELIVHGSTQPSSRVTLQGERVTLRPDGTFTMRFRLPDKRLIIPATAASPEGGEERTIVLAVERNTKELEPMVHDHVDD